MTRSSKLIAHALTLTALVGLLGLFVWKLAHQHHPPQLGSTAPGFSLQRLDRTGSIDLASLRGSAVVLNFWASWCLPCKAEATALERDYLRYRPQGVVFVGVDYHDVTADARRFIRAHGLSFPTVEDGSGDVTENRYGIGQVPETYVLDRRGRIVLHIPGPITDLALAGQLRRALSRVAGS